MAGLPDTLEPPISVPSQDTEDTEGGHDPYSSTQDFAGIETGGAGDYATVGPYSTMHGDDGCRPIEVFVGGLATDVDESVLLSAFQEVGEVVDVQIRRTKGRGSTKVPCGIAFVYFKDAAAAEAATREVKQIRGRPVAVHLSKSRLPDDVEDTQGVPPLHLPSDPTHTLSQLLPALRGELHKRAAVSLALKELSEEKERAGVAAAPTAAASASVAAPSRSATAPSAGRAATPTTWIMDSATYLEHFPLCNQLIQKFSEQKTPKTPMSILHEYATRTSMQITYEETAEGPLGPFLMEAKLMEPESNTYHTGTGRGKTKKDAKQFAAATVLEQLLKSLPQTAFLGNTKGSRKLPTKLAPGLGYEESRGGPYRRGGGFGGRGRGGGSVPIKFVRSSEVTLPNYGRDYVPALHMGQAKLQQQQRSMQQKAFRPPTSFQQMQGGEVSGHKRSFAAAMNELPPMDMAAMGHAAQDHSYEYSAVQPTIQTLNEYNHEANSGYFSTPIHHQAAAHQTQMRQDQNIVYIDSGNAQISRYGVPEQAAAYHQYGAQQSGYEQQYSHHAHHHHHHAYGQHY